VKLNLVRIVAVAVPVTDDAGVESFLQAADPVDEFDDALSPESE